MASISAEPGYGPLLVQSIDTRLLSSSSSIRLHLVGIQLSLSRLIGRLDVRLCDLSIGIRLLGGGLSSVSPQALLKEQENVLNASAR